MSPWDLQPCELTLTYPFFLIHSPGKLLMICSVIMCLTPAHPGNQEQDTGEEGPSNMALSDEELEALSYEPSETDWLGEGREQMTQRIMSSMEALCQLSMAGPFVYPVDVQAYPDYWSIVPFPNDLSTIIQKLENKFYRFVTHVQWLFFYINCLITGVVVHLLQTS